MMRQMGVGSMLRTAWTEIIDEILAELIAAGFDDLRPIHRPILRDLLALNLRPSELATRMGVSKQAANDVVRELEGKGYITLEPDPADGRSKRIVSTARGRKAYETAFRAGQGVGARWAGLVGEEDFVTFVGVLRAIVENGQLDAADAAGAPARAPSGPPSRRPRAH